MYTTLLISKFVIDIQVKIRWIYLNDSIIKKTLNAYNFNSFRVLTFAWIKVYCCLSTNFVSLSCYSSIPALVTPVVFSLVSLLL